MEASQPKVPQPTPSPADYRDVYRLNVEAYASLEEALADVVRTVAALLGMRYTAVTRIDGGREYTLMYFNGRRTSSTIRPLPLQKTYCERVLDCGGPAKIEDASEIDELQDHFALRHGIRSYVAVPLKLSDGRLYGTLCGFESEARQFGQREIEILEMIARRVVFDIERKIAADRLAAQNDELQQTLRELDNAQQLIRRELAMARGIQQHLLPLSPPRFDGGRLVSEYQALAEVGGDFIDYHIDSSGRLGIFIGDASGHGVPAALIGSMAKIALEHTREVMDQPATVVSHLNRALADRTNDNFVSAIYAVFEPQQRRLRYVNAGHPAPYLLRSGAPSPLSGQGKLLALLPDAVWQEHSIELQAGDAILFVTDGALECRQADGNALGEQAIEEIIGELAKESVEALPTCLILRLREIVGERGFEDDVTVVLLQVD